MLIFSTFLKARQILLSLLQSIYHIPPISPVCMLLISFS